MKYSGFLLRIPVLEFRSIYQRRHSGGVESYRATNFPTQLGLGHTWNRDLIYKVGRITGREGRMLGYTNVYAPILDVGRD